MQPASLLNVVNTSQTVFVFFVCVLQRCLVQFCFERVAGGFVVGFCWVCVCVSVCECVCVRACVRV